MKIALPVWNERISPLFDTARTIMLVELHEGKEIGRTQVGLEEFPVPRVRQLLTLGVNVLLCGAISRPFFDIINSQGIRTFPFITGEAEEVLKAYIQGNCPGPRFYMPGCNRRQKRFRKGSGFRNVSELERDKS